MSCCPETGLMSVEDALKRLTAGVGSVAVPEQVRLNDACGRVLAQDIKAEIDVPPHDNSAMDGYAFQSSDLTAENKCLPIGLRVAAGDAQSTLEPGTAARIFTGAPVPFGADTVVMQESCRVSDDKVEFQETHTPGANIRRKGEDISLGTTILTAGKRLQPQDIGLLASIGCADIPVYRKLRVGILSSGDELLEPGSPSQPGKIYNSNRYMLSALLTRWGYDVSDFGVVKDTLEDTLTALQEASALVDVIMTTGGVSVGEEDHIKSAVSALGELQLWRVAIKPGKPFAYGRIGNTVFIGLPGNPVSVMVTSMVLALPLLEKLQGKTESTNLIVQLPAWFSIDKPGKRDEFLRVRKDRVDGVLGLKAYHQQSSGALSSASWSDGLAWIPKGLVVTKGQLVDYLPYESIGC